MKQKPRPLFDLLVQCTVFFGALACWWLLVFQIFRFAFVLINPAEFSDFLSVGRALSSALRLDLSTAAWFCSVTLIVLIFENLAGRRWVTLHRFVVAALLLSHGFLAISESAAYPEWQSKLNYKIVSMLWNPGELFAIASPGLLVLMSSVLAVCCASLMMLWAGFIQPLLPAALNMPWWQRLRGALVSTCLLVPIVISARGGVQAIPVSMAAAYNSHEQQYNDLAVNASWNMGFQMLTLSPALSQGNAFEFMPLTDAGKITRVLLDPAGIRGKGKVRAESESLLTSNSPNIVVLVLESWSSDMVSSLVEGPVEFSPEFRKLESDGVLFTNFFANGNRSQQGMTSLMTGFPALGLVAVPDNLSFVARLPGLAKSLGAAGYDSAFVYGGQLEYGNINALIYSAGFANIRSGEENFPPHLRRGAMGVQDGEIVDEVLAECDKLKRPFLCAQFTLSTHAPYDFPGADAQPDPVFKGMKEELFARSVRYSDAALGQFFAKARTREWYKDTLFVLVADHSHVTWRNLPNWHPDYRRIPLLLTGPAVKTEYRGKKIDVVGSQVDLSATLLGQLGIDAGAFEWSRDMLASGARRQAFAHYELNYGFGFVTPDGAVVYDKQSKRLLLSTLPPDKEEAMVKAGMAYTQCSMQTFMDGTLCGK